MERPPAGLRMRLSLDHHPHYAAVWVPSPHQLDIFVRMRAALVTTVLAAAVLVAAGPASAGVGPGQIARAVRKRRAVALAVGDREHLRAPGTATTSGCAGRCRALGFSSSLSMVVQVNYWSRAQQRFLPIQSRPGHHAAVAGQLARRAAAGRRGVPVQRPHRSAQRHVHVHLDPRRQGDRPDRPPHHRRPHRRRPRQPAALQRGAVPDQARPAPRLQPAAPRQRWQPGAPERRCGCRRPGRARSTFAPHRGHGRPARRNTRGSPSMRPCRAECRIRGRTASTIAIASSSLTDDTGRHGSTRGLPARPRTSRCSRSRRRCADRAAPRRSRAWGRRRAGGARNRSESNSSARMSGPSAASRWSKRARLSVISSSTGPSNCDHLGGRARAAPARPRAASGRQRRPGGYTPQAPVMRRCEWSTRSPVEVEEQVLAVGADLGDRAAGQALGPAVQRVAGVRGADLVGHVALQHRAHPVRRIGDRVALGHRAAASGRRASAAAGPPGSRARSAPAPAASSSPTRRRPSPAPGA